MMYFSIKRLSVTSFSSIGVFCLIVIALALTPALAQETAVEDGSMQGGAAPADARDPDAQSGGYEYRGMGGWEETDEIVFSKVISDQLEFRNNDGGDTLRWDIQGWRGTDYKKLWVKFEGDDEVSSSAGELELQALYSRSVTSFWEFQVGGRFDRAYDSGVSSNRFLAVIGFQGLAPYWFDLEPALFVSEDGDVSARITGTYDLLFSQRLILQPRFEANVAASEVREFFVGSGFNDIQLGFRLRYEFRREVAPYIGVSWQRQFGSTADLTRADGGDIDNLAFVAGLRFWF